MDIEGKYTLPNGDVLEAFLNVAVKREMADGSFRFRRYSLSDFIAMIEAERSVDFEPKEGKVDE